MRDRVRPDVVVFDVVETLASLDPVGRRLVELGQPLDLWRGGSLDSCVTVWR